MSAENMKTVPQRKCVGCGTSRNKNELIRIVRSPENEISIDRRGKKSGRGAYICMDANCLKKAVKTKRIDKNLRVTISEEIIKALTTEIESGE